jgi:diguanylate cyclase (GGDEF)-like protein/PAS domain S-box-containing protein
MLLFVILYIIINLLSAVICTTVAILVPQRTAQADWGFRFFALITGLWCATSGLFFLNQDIRDLWIWTGIQLVAYATIPVFWFYFILQYTGDRTPKLALLFAIPILTLLVYWNPSSTNLMWKITESDFFGVTTANYEREAWFKFIHTPYCYSLIILGHSYLFRAIFQGRRKYSQPLFILLLCGLIPLILNVITLSPLYKDLRFFDLTPIGLAISSVLFCWNLSRHQILRRSPLAYRHIFSSIQDAILVTDTDYQLIEFNQSAENLFEFKSIDIGKSIKDLINIFDASHWEDLTSKNKTEIEFQNQYFNVNQNIIYRKKKELGYIINVSDITQSRRLQEEILKGALLYDALTKLPNRTLFSEKLKQVLKENSYNLSENIAVAFIDIDRFKIINDSLGHTIGDQVLIAIAQRIQSCLLSEDMVARFGGDEFSILVKNAHSIDIKFLSKKLQSQIQEPIFIDSHVITTSGSTGIAFSHPQITAEQLIQHADIAMYQAKSHGRGSLVIYEQSFAQKALERMELEVSLRQALKKQELFLVYQPVVEIKSGKLKGFEALVRWQHPSYGLILPSVFIPIAEEMGLVSMLDRWVLFQACQQLHEWEEQYPKLDVTLSINLSTANFMFANLIETILDVLNNTHVSTSRLKLEITESMLMKDPDASSRVLEQLKDYGIDVLLDDFGTGHSSLSYLRQLPIRGLKIDQSFVQAVKSDEQSLAIIKMIISLAQNLNIKLIAEGVETDAQRQVLEDLGCCLGQGYFWWKPLYKTDASNVIKSLSNCA